MEPDATLDFIATNLRQHPTARRIAISRRGDVVSAKEIPVQGKAIRELAADLGMTVHAAPDFTAAAQFNAATGTTIYLVERD